MKTSPLPAIVAAILAWAAVPFLGPSLRSSPAPQSATVQRQGTLTPQDRRELRAIAVELDSAEQSIGSARSMLLDFAMGGGSGAPGGPGEPGDDGDTGHDDPPAPGDDFDAAAFETAMLATDRSSYMTVGPHGGGQYCLTVSHANSGETIANRRFEMGKIGILGGGNFPNENLIRDLTVRDCEFTASPIYDGASYWGLRLYNTVGLVLDGIYAHDFGERSEHVYYGNPVGSVTVRNIYGARIGGQLFQGTNREEAGANHDIPDHGENSPWQGGSILLERFVARDCGMSEARGSFPVSIKDVGRPGRPVDVTIRDGLITSNFAPQLRSGRMVSATGGILVNGFGSSDWHNGIVVIENVVVDVTRTSHAVLQVNNCRKLIVRNCTFRMTDGYYGDALIDRVDGDYAGALRTGEIVWQGNTGNVNLRVGGQVVGPVDRDFTRTLPGLTSEIPSYRRGSTPPAAAVQIEANAAAAGEDD